MKKGKKDPYKKCSIKVLGLSQEIIVQINDYIRTDLNQQMKTYMIIAEINRKFNINLTT